MEMVLCNILQHSQHYTTVWSGLDPWNISKMIKILWAGFSSANAKASINFTRHKYMPLLTTSNGKLSYRMCKYCRNFTSRELLSRCRFLLFMYFSKAIFLLFSFSIRALYFFSQKHKRHNDKERERSFIFCAFEPEKLRKLCSCSCGNRGSEGGKNYENIYSTKTLGFYKRSHRCKIIMNKFIQYKPRLL